MEATGGTNYGDYESEEDQEQEVIIRETSKSYKSVEESVEMKNYIKEDTAGTVTHIYLDFNQINDGLQFFAQFTLIKELNLGGNKIESCASFPQLANLTDLLLDGNQIVDNLDDLLPNFLLKFPKLKYLLLQDNPIHPGDSADEKSMLVFRAKFKLWIKSLENLDMDQYGKKDQKMIEELREEEQLKINQVQIDM